MRTIKNYGDDGTQDAALVDITAEIKAASPKAWKLFDGTKTEWVPRSLVENNGDGTFTMPEWLAKEKGFI